jgi:hypothetical protein
MRARESRKEDKSTEKEIVIFHLLTLPRQKDMSLVTGGFYVIHCGECFYED